MRKVWIESDLSFNKVCVIVEYPFKIKKREGRHRVSNLWTNIKFLRSHKSSGHRHTWSSPWSRSALDAKMMENLPFGRPGFVVLGPFRQVIHIHQIVKYLCSEMVLVFFFSFQIDSFVIPFWQISFTNTNILVMQ